MFHKNTKEKHCSYSKQYNKHPDSLRIVSDKSIYEEQFPYADQWCNKTKRKPCSNILKDRLINENQNWQE